VILYAIGYGADWDDATIVAERLDNGERKVLVKGGTFPRYLPTGHPSTPGRGASTRWLRPESLAVAGPPVEVARNVVIHLTGFAQMDVSRSGLLVTAPVDSEPGRMSSPGSTARAVASR